MALCGAGVTKGGNRRERAAEKEKEKKKGKGSREGWMVALARRGRG